MSVSETRYDAAEDSLCYDDVATFGEYDEAAGGYALRGQGRGSDGGSGGVWRGTVRGPAGAAWEAQAAAQRMAGMSDQDALHVSHNIAIRYRVVLHGKEGRLILILGVFAAIGIPATLRLPNPKPPPHPAIRSLSPFPPYPQHLASMGLAGPSGAGTGTGASRARVFAGGPSQGGHGRRTRSGAAAAKRRG